MLSTSFQPVDAIEISHPSSTVTKLQPEAATVIYCSQNPEATISIQRHRRSWGKKRREAWAPTEIWKVNLSPKCWTLLHFSLSYCAVGTSATHEQKLPFWEIRHVSTSPSSFPALSLPPCVRRLELGLFVRNVMLLPSFESVLLYFGCDR